MTTPVRRGLTLLALLAAVFAPSAAQEGTWTVSAWGGLSLLSFSSVNGDGERDIAAYHDLGVPIGDYPKLRTAPVVGGMVTYRFDRDAGVGVFAAYRRARTTTAYRDSAEYLSLDRVLSSTDIGVDLWYYLPPLIGGGEVSILLGLGSMTAHADQTTMETRTEKSGPSTLVHIIQDAFGANSKSKLFVRAGVQGTLPLTGPLSLGLSALVRYAPLGTMDGTLREFSNVRPYTTTIEFDYSTVDLQIGLTYTL